MAVKLRLSPQGSKARRFYRIVAIHSAHKPRGAFLEVVGTYDPIKEAVVIHLDLAQAWLQKGAQPSPRVKRLLKKVQKQAAGIGPQAVASL